MEYLTEKSIGEIVAENLNTASVFEKHEMDYCCNGKLSLTDACKRFKVDLNILKKELASLQNNIHSFSLQVSEMSLDALIAHIVNTHHVFLRDLFPKLKEHLKKAMKVHGSHHPELHEMFSLFIQVEQDILPHLSKEEQILHPYIKNMLEAERNHTLLSHACFKTVQTFIQTLEKEHEGIGILTDNIRKSTHNYKVPEDACNTYRLTLSELQEMERDLHLHIVKENQILHPKAIALEKKLFCLK